MGEVLLWMRQRREDCSRWGRRDCPCGYLRSSRGFGRCRPSGRGRLRWWGWGRRRPSIHPHISRIMPVGGREEMRTFQGKVGYLFGWAGDLSRRRDGLSRRNVAHFPNWIINNNNKGRFFKAERCSLLHDGSFAHSSHYLIIQVRQF